jgi:hypothetical protein
VFKFLAAKADWHDYQLMLEPDFPGDPADEAIYVPVASIEDNTDVQLRFSRRITTRP